MPDFATTYAPADVLLLGNEQPVLGTVMLGDAFGVIKHATVTRSGKRELITDEAKTLRLLLITNPGFECMLDCCFDATVTAPGLLEQIDLPLVGVTGRVMEGVSVQWEDGGERMLSIPVAQWDSMESATAYRLAVGGTLTTI
jgi:hypothetical protein